MILHGLSRPDFLTDTGLPDLLEATAARQPDRPALYWGELCLSYGELLARASLAAHHLLQAGAAPGQHIDCAEFCSIVFFRQVRHDFSHSRAVGR
jgi:non-ribosomal peptide synthetase component F